MTVTEIEFGLAYVDAEHQPYIRCRTIGHSWFDTNDSTWVPRKGGVPFVCRCERCLMERRDRLQEGTGILLGRTYSKIKGYAWGKEEGLPTRAQFRLLLRDLQKKEAAA